MFNATTTEQQRFSGYGWVDSYDSISKGRQ